MHKRSCFFLPVLLLAGSVFIQGVNQPIKHLRDEGIGLLPGSNDVRVAVKEIMSIGVEDGDPNYLFAKPTNVVVDGKGNIYIIEMFQKIVRKYDKTGKFLATIGRDGGGPGEYKMPSVAAVDSKDNFYIFDFTAMRVSIFGPGGSFERSFVPGFLAGGICVTAKGEIILCGIKDGKMFHQFDGRGKLIASFGEPWQMSADSRMAGFNFAFACLGPDGCIYSSPVPNPNQILKGDPSARTVVSIAQNGPGYTPLTMTGKGPSGSMTRGLIVLRDGTIVLSVSFAKDGKPVEQLDFYSKEGMYLVSSTEIKGTPRCVDREGALYFVTGEPFPRVVKYSVILQGS